MFLLPALYLAACSTDPEPLTCAEGELLDGDACIPEVCGTGTWGDLQTDSDTLYVSAAADADGDGSRDRPFPTIQQGLDAQDEPAMVAVAAGTYVENLQMTGDHKGAHLAGRCRELVTIDGSAGTEDNHETGSGIFLYGPGLHDSWTVSGLTLTGAPWAGILVGHGSLALERVSATHNGRIGLDIEFGNLDAVDCVVRDNLSAGV
ncbi:MAG: right-handed parallel beta-helix repeat-containing protein, partial [Myxococcota bacterium]|nr:right-handed parallel beta-helix repeat-containing protein [Myxococcota bacterium]